MREDRPNIRATRYPEVRGKGGGGDFIDCASGIDVYDRSDMRRSLSAIVLCTFVDPHSREIYGLSMIPTCSMLNLNNPS